MGSEMCIRDRQQCTEHATTNCLQRYNATAPSSSRQHHARVTGLRCTVSSCFGKHLRSITHRIYSYHVYLGCCRCSSASFGTTPRYMYQHTTIAPVAVGNAMHVWKIRAVRCRAAVEPEVYISAGAMQHLHAACICTHVASYQPGAVGVQTVSIVLLLYGLKSSRSCSLPWPQGGSRRQPREGSSTYAYHTCLSST